MPSADLAGIEGPVEAPVIGLAVVNLSAVCNELEALNDSGAFSSASGHLYPRIARAKAATPGEKRRPAIDTRETSRTTSGSATTRVRTPGIVGENPGIKQIPNPEATIIWIQFSRSLRKPIWSANPCSGQRSLMSSWYSQLIREM